LLALALDLKRGLVLLLAAIVCKNTHRASRRASCSSWGFSWGGMHSQPKMPKQLTWTRTRLGSLLNRRDWFIHVLRCCVANLKRVAHDVVPSQSTNVYQCNLHIDRRPCTRLSFYNTMAVTLAAPPLVFDTDNASSCTHGAASTRSTVHVFNCHFAPPPELLVSLSAAHFTQRESATQPAAGPTASPTPESSSAPGSTHADPRD